MNSIRNQFSSIEQVTGKYLNSNSNISNINTADSTKSFEQILQEQQISTVETENSEGLKFSKHALNRLSQRNIELSSEQKERLEEGTQIAEKKGIKDSLVIMDQLAFIVNVPNQTVVTAMDQTETMENVYTNIDGAVII